jgi:hypothetical protein
MPDSARIVSILFLPYQEKFLVCSYARGEKDHFKTVVFNNAGEMDGILKDSNTGEDVFFFQGMTEGNDVFLVNYQNTRPDQSTALLTQVHIEERGEYFYVERDADSFAKQIGEKDSIGQNLWYRYIFERDDEILVFDPVRPFALKYRSTETNQDLLGATSRELVGSASFNLQKMMVPESSIQFDRPFRSKRELTDPIAQFYLQSSIVGVDGHFNEKVLVAYRTPNLEYPSFRNLSDSFGFKTGNVDFPFHLNLQLLDKVSLSAVGDPYTVPGALFAGRYNNLAVIFEKGKPYDGKEFYDLTGSQILLLETD